MILKLWQDNIVYKQRILEDNDKDSDVFLTWNFLSPPSISSTFIDCALATLTSSTFTSSISTAKLPVSKLLLDDMMETSVLARLVSFQERFVLLWLILTMLALSFFHSESTYELVGGGFCLQHVDGVGGQFLITALAVLGFIVDGMIAWDMSGLDRLRFSRDLAAASLKLFRAVSS